MFKEKIEGKILKSLHETADSQYVFIYDYRTELVEWSEEACEFFGFPRGELRHFLYTLKDNIHPDDVEKCQEELIRVLTLKQDSFYKSYHMKDAEGNYMLCRGKGKVYRDEAGNAISFAGTISVCSEEVSYDSVSGLQTVNGFCNKVESYNESDTEYLVLAVVIHHFHDVNSMYGYDFGNKVLYELSNAFRDLVGRDSTGHVYRIESTTFTFLLKEQDIEYAKKVYEAAKRITSQFELDGYALSMDVLGVVWSSMKKKQNPNLILSALVSVIDEAKINENYELVVFDDSMRDEMSKSTELINVIKNSIQHDCEGFYLCYQPFVSTITGKIIGAEALIRWRNEEYGTVSPYRFVPQLESNPCFYELGLWIIKQAVTDAKKIREMCPLFFINVNMSYSQLQHEGFKEAVVKILDEVGFPREGLQLELTERCRNLDLKFLQEQLKFFKENNIKIALDDFGTGTSTIELLCELPIDCVKIDQTFILNILDKGSNQVIVDTTLQCTRRLGINVCLEGVENQEIKEFVERYSASYHQGYYYSRPVEYDEFVKNIHKNWNAGRLNIIKGNGRSRFDVNNILSMIPGGFFIYVNDEEERITCVNEALLKMLECESAEDFYELTNNTFRGLVYPEDYEAVEASINRQIAGSDTKMDYVKYRIVTKSGKVKWFHDYGHLVKNDQDEDVFYVFVGEVRDDLR